MTLHHLAAAFRLLTRIPMPVTDVGHDHVAQAARWFPLVGGVIGMALFTLASLPATPPISALLITLIWIAITGGLHLDGAADLADGLGAAHGKQTRLLAVMKDPHIGTFGTLALITIIITKLTTMIVLVTASPQVWALVLIPAWARLGTLYWMRTLKPLGSGLGAQYQHHISNTAIILWSLLLITTSIALVSSAFAATAFITLLAWRWFLHQRVGGMNGDCLGAGIEYCECVMLLALVLIP